MNRTGLALVLFGVVLNAIAQFCLKSATVGGGPIGLGGSSLVAGLGRVIALPWFWIGASCYAMSIVVWLLALSRVPVSVAYPMLSIGSVLTAMAARLWLGEELGAARLAGIAIIIIGVFVLASGRNPVSAP